MSSLFHYTKFCTLIDHILPSGLLSNGLNSMNDPREAQAWTFGGKNLPYKELYPNYNNNNHIDCQFKFGKLFKDKFQIVCFSGAIDGWNNEMMWAHYSDNHTGMCIEFDEEQLIRDIETRYPNTQFHIKDILYDNSEKSSMIFWDQQLSQHENIKSNIDRIYKDQVLVKSNNWSNERERRLVFLNVDEKVLVPINNSLKSIYLGLKFNHENLAKLNNLVNKFAIKLYDIVYQDNCLQKWLRPEDSNKLPISSKY